MKKFYRYFGELIIMKRFKRQVVLVLAVLATVFAVYPQLTSRVGVDVRPSYAFSSFRDDVLQATMDMEHAKTTRFAGSVHLKYGFTFSPDSKEGQFYPGVWQGLGAGVNFFGNNKGLGTPVSIYLFQGAPVWKIQKNLSLYYEWNFGLSAGWRPSDGVTAASNLIVGSRVNAYINLGTGILWKINSHYSLTAGLEVTHFSNGNTSFPNPGVNLAGLRLGVTRTFGEERQTPMKPFPEDTVRKKKFGVDVTVYGAWRKRVYRGNDIPVLLRGNFLVVGIDINPMWNLSRLFRIGPSLDVQWDESTDLKRNYAEGTNTDDIYFYRPNPWRQICWGISARGELVMPLFSVNIGIGYNPFGPMESRATYQMANLKIRIIKGLYANIGYQLLDFQKQNNLMLGVGYRF